MTNIRYEEWSNRMNFWKSAKWGGGHFNPKICIADFGNLKQGFLSMKLLQKGNFRVQVCSTIVLKNQNKTDFEEGISYYLALIFPCTYTTIPIIIFLIHLLLSKNLQSNFLKIRGV